MNREACVELGKIVKAHGLEGEMRLSLDVQDPNDYTGIRLLYLGRKDEPLFPVVVKTFEPLSATEAILLLDEIRDRSGAEAWIGATVYFPMEMLPKLPEGHYYFFEIVGFHVHDQQHGDIGTVQEVRDLPGNDLLVVSHNHREVLIPMTEPILLKVDKSRKVVEVNLPEGLLELYLE